MKGFKPQSENAALHPSAAMNMVAAMQDCGVEAFQHPGRWEECLCAAVLAFEPKCKPTRLLDHLPYGKAHYDEI
ncbi:MAG: hypothetical protein DI626_09845, partial [Micavibrio aeruginosavorus]